MNCILKRPKRYRITVRMDPPRGDFDLLVTSTSQSQAAAAALAAFGLGQDKLVDVKRVKPTRTKPVHPNHNY